jgi:hypothetical protein
VPNRRDLVLGLSTLPLLDASGACAEATKNSDLLKCELFCDNLAKLSSQFSFVAALEASKVCRIFVPLAFGYRGFRLYVDDGSGPKAPPFYPPTEPPYWGMFKDPTNYLLMYAGQVVGMRMTVSTKELFPAAGRFSLSLQYVPEPMRQFTNVPNAVVIEDGDVMMAPKAITVAA